MTSKDYFRQLSLMDFGYPADEKVVDFHNYLNNEFSNLIKYTNNIYPTLIFYGKKDGVIIFQQVNDVIKLHANGIINEIEHKFDLQKSDIEDILLHYITGNKKIKSKKMETTIKTEEDTIALNMIIYYCMQL